MKKEVSTNTAQVYKVSKEIKYVALEGGGLKGICYLGVFRAMIDNGIWNDIEAIAGSSAGAIAALVGCTGWGYNEMLELFLGIDFEKLLTTDSGSDTNTRKGKIIETITDPINLPLNIMREYGLHKHKPLLKEIEKIVAKVSGLKNCTFAQWHALRVIRMEKKMKDIFCEAGCLDTGYNDVFSWKNPETRDVPISLAITASCAFPFYITPVTINDFRYVDGGIQGNCPWGVFDITPGIPNENLLCVMLKDRKEVVISSPQKKPIHNILQYGEAVLKLAERTQGRSLLNSGYILYTFSCDTMGLNTFDYEKFSLLKDKLLDNSYTTTVKYLRKRREG